MAVVIQGASEHVVLLGNLVFKLGNQVVELVKLLAHPTVVLSEPVKLLELLCFKVTYFPLVILEGSEQFLVLPVQDVLALLNHFDLLLERLDYILCLLHFLISRPVLEIPDFLLKVQLVTDQNIIKFLIFQRKLLESSNNYSLKDL